jgi:hypothetical protein
VLPLCVMGPTVRYAVPTIFEFREFAAAGGLMSYGGSCVCRKLRPFGFDDRIA